MRVDGLTARGPGVPEGCIWQLAYPSAQYLIYSVCIKFASVGNKICGNQNIWWRQAPGDCNSERGISGASHDPQKLGGTWASAFAHANPGRWRFLDPVMNLEASASTDEVAVSCFMKIRAVIVAHFCTIIVAIYAVYRSGTSQLNMENNYKGQRSVCPSASKPKRWRSAATQGKEIRRKLEARGLSRDDKGRRVLNGSDCSEGLERERQTTSLKAERRDRGTDSKIFVLVSLVRYTGRIQSERKGEEMETSVSKTNSTSARALPVELAERGSGGYARRNHRRVQANGWGLRARSGTSDKRRRIDTPSRQRAAPTPHQTPLTHKPPASIGVSMVRKETANTKGKTQESA
ncbi:hypothetical protein B0H10DRAFT_2196517 [Mycena sp. CBHHK59/15]|nr:hypothetical protein B0H10DRAFT_2196517 [Mycena sp. CBHHK59/15]